MIGMVRFLLGGALSLAMAATVCAASAEVRLRETLVVQGPEITLGDIFQGVSGGAATAFVAAAPPPGQRLLLRGGKLQSLAARHGVQWRRPNHATRIEVARAGSVVPRTAILAALKAAIQDLGVTGPLEIELRVHGRKLVVALGAVPSVAIEALNFDRRSGRFVATVSAPAGDPAASSFRATGRAVRMAEVPVLRRVAARGDVISADDLDWLLLPADKLNHAVVTDADDLVGMAAKRVIRSGRPVRARDIGRPVMVKKGALVTMTLTSPSIVITATGRAEEAGGEGDVIRVRNNQSHTVVQGLIASPSDVIIRARRRFVSAAN
jgi:flagella basal body P-ring formation protein FlgA